MTGFCQTTLFIIAFFTGNMLNMMIIEQYSKKCEQTKSFDVYLTNVMTMFKIENAGLQSHRDVHLKQRQERQIYKWYFFL